MRPYNERSQVYCVCCGNCQRLDFMFDEAEVFYFVCSACLRRIYCLSVRQPWAWLIGQHYKLIETRLWPTSYRGDLLIVASKRLSSKEIMAPFYKSYAVNESVLRRGVSVCVARLADVRPMAASDEKYACCGTYPGAYSWCLENIRTVYAVPVTGRLKLFKIDHSILRKVV